MRAHAAQRRVVPPDYDERPDRLRTARAVLREHGPGGDVHARVAERLLAEGLTPVLDVGCGEGELARHLPAGAWIGVDASPTMLARAPQPAVRARATRLPFADASVASVALLYVLYHLEDPVLALQEARRVLRPGGLLAVAAPSRHDSPELAHLLPAAPTTFDAELGRDLLLEIFANAEISPWDAPLLRLPTRAAVRDYLIGKGLDRTAAESGTAGVWTPLTVTKRGALLYARRRATPT